MNDHECLQLRDTLFARRFEAGHKERVFRLMAVMPGGADPETEATVHYAISPTAWDRGGANPKDSDAFVGALIRETQAEAHRIAIRFHEHLGKEWPFSWGITAMDSVDNFPTLVLFEHSDGRVEGALMRDRHSGLAGRDIGEAAAEPAESIALTARLRGMEQDEMAFSLFKESNLSAPSLDAAIATTPETVGGQKAVLIYRGAEWLTGIWNNPDKQGDMAGKFHLYSVADSQGTRVSEAKLATREGIGSVRDGKTLQGDYQVLLQALLETKSASDSKHGEYEQHPGVRMLCEWWNTFAPEQTRSAGAFRLYVWDEVNRIFEPGDGEEPPMEAKHLVEPGSLALFEAEGRPSVAVLSHRGRAFNREEGGGIQTFFVSGEKSYATYGPELDEIDEAYYAVQGLWMLSRMGL